MTGKQDRTAAKRKAWTYEPPAAPPLRDYMAGGEQRQRFVKYWIRDNIGNARDIFCYFAFKLLTARACSNLGGWMGRTSVPRWHAAAYSRAAANIRMMRPGISDAELDELLERYADSQGRQMAEYSVVPRLARGGVRHEGTAAIAARCVEGPVIFVGTHTSNWEVLWHSLLDLGLDVTMNYDPPKRRSRHWIVNRVRKNAGLGILKPGRSFVRPALRIIEDGGNLLMFCDEGFNGKIRAPFFGRPPHLEGNYALIARMARKTGALIYPVYMIREEGTRFRLHALDPFHLPPEEASGSRLVEDVQLLNSVIEPIVRAHPEQWFFIDNRMPPTGKPAKR